MSSPYGYANAQEVEVAHRIAESDEFNDEPVGTYQKLLTEHGVESTGRIWSLACRLWDDAHGRGGD
jgi:hypothetical protein